MMMIPFQADVNAFLFIYMQKGIHKSTANRIVVTLITPKLLVCLSSVLAQCAITHEAEVRKPLIIIVAVTKTHIFIS